jgi:hypothetical protein
MASLRSFGNALRALKTTIVLPLALTRPCSSSTSNTRPAISREQPTSLESSWRDTFYLHAVRMGHGVGLIAQIHDRVSDSACDIDKCQVA